MEFYSLKLASAEVIGRSYRTSSQMKSILSLLRGSARYTGQRMTWRFRKSLKLGPIRLNLSKSGVGYSIGGRGFRVGQDAKGRSYTAASIPGTCLYSREYSSQGKAAGGGVASTPGAAVGRNSGVGLAVGMLAAAFVAGVLVTLLLTALLSTPPVAPPMTPPAAVSAPVDPPAPVKPAKKRRRGHLSVEAAKRATASHVPKRATSQALAAAHQQTSDVPLPAN